MVYADYEYYTGTYLGTAVRETEFPRLALRASSFLTYYTRGRAARCPCLDALKMACCAVAEQYQRLDAAQALAAKSLSSALASGEAGELQSQSVGSWSKTYRSAGGSAQDAAAFAQDAQAALADAARQYLDGTGLLYRGRGCGDGHVPAYGDGL